MKAMPLLQLPDTLMVEAIEDCNELSFLLRRQKMKVRPFVAPPSALFLCVVGAARPHAAHLLLRAHDGMLLCVCVYAVSDSSFMSLLSKLSKLEFPDRDPSQLERCPLCSAPCTLEAFADHVYR
jgi:hypothetical protein